MFKKRVLASLIALFVSGVGFAVLLREYDTVSFRAIFIGLAVIASAVLVYSRVNCNFNLSKRIVAVTIAVTAFSFGVLRVSLFNDGIKSADFYNGKSDKIEATVTEIISGGVNVKITNSEEGVSQGTKIRLYLSDKNDSIRIGDTVSATVYYKKTENPNLYSDRIFLTTYASNVEISEGKSLYYAARNVLSSNIAMQFEGFEYASDISKAVVMGDRNGVDSYIFAVYRAGGISHILAISGLHISLIVMSFHKFLCLLRVNRRASSVISMLLAVIYTALVGFTPGCVRASVMICFLLLSEMRFRRSDSATALFFALFLLLLVNPYSICSASLQLSFLCSLGIIVAGPLIEAIEDRYCYRKRNSTVKSLIIGRIFAVVVIPFIISVSSLLFSFPVIFLRFDTVSYLSPIFNIVVVPFFSFAIKLSLIALLISPISSAVASVIAYPAGIIYDCATGFNALLHENDIGVVSLQTPCVYIVFIASLAVICVLLFKTKRHKRAFMVSTAVFALCFAISAIASSYIEKDRVMIEYSDELSEYIYCHTPNGNIYFDINGYVSQPDAVYESGSVSLDAYVIVQYNAYTYRRIEYLLGNLSVGDIFAPKPKNNWENDIYLQIKELAKRRNCVIIEFDRSYSFEISPSDYAYIINDNADSSALIGFELSDKSFAIPCGNYNHPIKSDTIIITDEYSGEGYMLDGGEIFVKESSVSDTNEFRGFLTYKNRIKFIGKIAESDFRVYES